MKKSKDLLPTLKTYIVTATDAAVKNGHAPSTFEIEAFDLTEACNKVAIIAETVGEKITN